MEKKLAGRIQTLVRNIRLKDGLIDGYDVIPNLRSVADFVGNIKNEHASPNQIFSYAYLQISIFVSSAAKKKYVEPEANGYLKDLVKRQVLEDFENYLIDEILEIPHAYNIRLMLEENTSCSPMCIRLSKDTYLEVTSSKKPNMHSLLTGKAKYENSTYLVIDTIGFCALDLSSSSIQHSLTTLKVFLFLAWSSYSTYNLEYRSSIRELETFDNHVIPKRKLIIEPKRNSTPFEVTLPIDITSLIANFGFRIKLYEFEVSDIKKVLDSRSKGVSRIKSAIEWYMDSITTQADTVKFVQICIGLESLLGDESPNAPLVATLADRCAYLVSSSIEKREELRKKFKSMYRVRSKIVHGTSRNLKENESEHYEFARMMLREAILKEISHLSLD